MPIGFDVSTLAALFAITKKIECIFVGHRLLGAAVLTIPLLKNIAATLDYVVGVVADLFPGMYFHQRTCDLLCLLEASLPLASLQPSSGPAKKF